MSVIESHQRQFHRLIEMIILKYLDHAESRAIRAYRLQVKERLFKFNYVCHYQNSTLTKD